VKVALLTYEYPPARGGIGNYAYNIAQHIKKFNTCVVFGRKEDAVDVPLFENYLEVKGAGYKNAWRILPFVTKHWGWNVIYAVEIDAAYPAYILSVLSRTSLVVTVLGNDILQAQKDKLRRKLSRRVFRRAERIICISDYTQKLMHKYYPFTKNKTVMIHPGVKT